MKHEEMINKAYFDFMMKQPFFGFLLSKIKRASLNESIPTMGTNGEYIVYNKDFVESISQGELNFVILHEIYHIMLLHPYRRCSRDAMLWNIACDYVVNANIYNDLSSIQKSGFNISFFSKALLRRDKKDHLSTAEQVYNELLDSDLVTQIQLIKSLEEGIGHDVVDNFSEVSEQHAKAFLVEAAEFSKNFGGSSSNIERIINDVTAKKLRWDVLLKRWMSLRESDDTSFDSPSRTHLPHGLIIPDTYLDETLPSGVIFAIDTSGSITIEQLSKFKAVARHAVEQYDVEGKLLYWDTCVQSVADMSDNKIQNVAPAGFGGTDPHCIFSYIKEKKWNPSAVVILTDGYFSQYTAPHNNVIWVIIEGGSSEYISKKSGVIVKL